MSAEIDFGPMMEPVALLLWGEPNPSLSKKGVELRYGTHGSLSVDLKKQTWFDHSANEGGGVLHALARDKGLSTPEALDWLRANGFDIPQSSAGSGFSNRDASPAKRTIVATYDYQDEGGENIFQVVRWQPKTFTQRRPYADEAGVYINGLKANKYMRRGPGADWWPFNQERHDRFKQNEVRDFPVVDKMPIYRLPEVLDAIANGQQIFFVEGEKDANNLWAAGMPATTVAGGSKKWQAHYAEYFRGAHVYLCPDNDLTGKQHMANVGFKLKGFAASIKIIDITSFWKDAPEKADLSDWQKAGNELDSLYDLLDDHARDWKPEKPESRFRAIHFEDLEAPGPEHEFLVQNLLTRREVALLYGASGSGKSFVGLDIALAIARGVPYRGFRTLRGGVIYQAGEGGIGIKKRVRAYRDFHMEDDEPAPPFVMLPARVDLFTEEDGEHNLNAGTNALIAEAKAWMQTMPVPLELIVIDTFSTATPGANENASQDMSKVLKNCERIQKECNCTVLIIHHTNAAGEKPRGHSSLISNVENSMECIATDRVDSEGRPDGPDLVRPIRRLVVRKNKDEEAGHGIDFILRQVKLGKNKYGEDVTSCVCDDLASQNDPDAKPLKILSDQQYNGMQALYRALSENGEPPPPELSLPASVQSVVLYRHWRVAYGELTFADDEDESKSKPRIKKALERCGTAFMRSHLIGKAGQYVWLTGKPVPGFGKAKESAPDNASQPYIDDYLDGEEIPF